MTDLLDCPATLRDDGTVFPRRAPVTTADLDALLRRVAHHDSAAFAGVILTRRAPACTGWSAGYATAATSEETTQDVYLQVWRTAESYDPASGSALAWLLTLAHRRAVDQVRSEQAATQRDSRYGAATVERDSDEVPKRCCPARIVAG